ncbi:MAG: phosphopantetheine-binding protein, partial [Acidobacteriota bacterium]
MTIAEFEGWLLETEGNGRGEGLAQLHTHSRRRPARVRLLAEELEGWHRWLPGGEIDIIGRIDHQVKVRGFRVELGEIESALGQHPGVAAQAVTLQGDGRGGKRLVAYVVPEADPEADGAPSPGELRSFLGASLPDYLVPSAYQFLDRLPLTPNGKVDRKALPAPDVSSTADAEPPEGDAEIGLADIWGEVLGRDGVGRRDNFFALGGDSVLAIQVVTRARGAGWTLEVREIFQHQTLAELAAVARVREPDQDAS